jgi:predicted RNase H-like HicB family nuclease
MNDVVLTYPTIFHESNDEDGHYYTVTSPNVEGMITEGETREEAGFQAIDAVATMLDGESNYPAPQDPATWSFGDGDTIMYIAVNMTQWLREKAQYIASQKNVRVNIMLPEYLRDSAKEKNLNISKVAAEALAKILV